MHVEIQVRFVFVKAK